MRHQHTLAHAIEVDGVGLHSGHRVRASLAPAPVNTGIEFRDGETPDNPAIPARFDRVTRTQLATTLGDGCWQVSTVEHLMAALLAEGIDNVTVWVWGREVPVLDGSAAHWIARLRSVGRRQQPAPQRRLVIRAPVEVREGPRWARLTPHPGGLTLSASICFAHPRIGRQALSLLLGAEAFSEHLAWARTFGFLGDVEALRRAGLARGGSLENVVVYDTGGVVNPEGLRREDEPIRHKMLDMVGDLALVGCPVEGHFEARRPGHALNLSLVKRLFATPKAWELQSG